MLCGGFSCSARLPRSRWFTLPPCFVGEPYPLEQRVLHAVFENSAKHRSIRNAIKNAFTSANTITEFMVCCPLHCTKKKSHRTWHLGPASVAPNWRLRAHFSNILEQLETPKGPPSGARFGQRLSWFTGGLPPSRLSSTTSGWLSEWPVSPPAHAFG